MVDIGEADGAFTEAVGGIHGDTVDADADRHIRRCVIRVAHVHPGHGHRPGFARRSSALVGAPVVHAGHRAVVHP